MVGKNVTSTLLKRKDQAITLGSKVRSAKMKQLRLIHKSYSRDCVCYLHEPSTQQPAKEHFQYELWVTHCHFLILSDCRERQRNRLGRRIWELTSPCTIGPQFFRSTVSLRWWSHYFNASHGKKVTHLMRSVPDTADMITTDRKAWHCLWREYESGPTIKDATPRRRQGACGVFKVFTDP
ncbi:hypothetical protein GWK47_053207 [Chionoecetes opilio]|uniref:Uncharacterized protein n=1 Tax=Chionoecetes opilio TaxID=41210 RepID=A0A8J5CRD8_CHIOP|nr:hypothetical protein GWK47_053207 [Chionoecetes opilio]